MTSWMTSHMIQCRGLGRFMFHILLLNKLGGPQKNICRQSWLALPSASLCQPDSVSGLDLRVKAGILSWSVDPHIIEVRGRKKFPCCCQEHSNLSSELKGQRAGKWNTNTMIFTFLILTIKMTLMRLRQSKQRPWESRINVRGWMKALLLRLKNKPTLW